MENTNNNMENTENYMVCNNGKKYEIEITGANVSESGYYYNYILKELNWRWRNIETGETGEETKYSFEWGRDFGAVYSDGDDGYVWEELEEKYGELGGEYNELTDEQKKEYDELYEQYIEDNVEAMIDWYNEDIENMPETLFDIIAYYMNNIDE